MGSRGRKWWIGYCAFLLAGGVVLMAVHHEDFVDLALGLVMVVTGLVLAVTLRVTRARQSS